MSPESANKTREQMAYAIGVQAYIWGFPVIINEHSLTTNDPATSEEVNKVFAHEWQQAVRFEDAEFGTSP